MCNFLSLSEMTTLIKEQDIFIKEILKEMKEIYELFDKSRKEADSLFVDLQSLLRSLKRYE